MVALSSRVLAAIGRDNPKSKVVPISLKLRPYLGKIQPNFCIPQFDISTAMGKRKRDTVEKEALPSVVHKKPAKTVHSSITDQKPLQQSGSTAIQIIVGSYDRVLHGITATIPEAAKIHDGSLPGVYFADTFLFNAHTSAIRCLAISPLPTLEDTGQSNKLILASGSTDERINLYHISAAAPTIDAKKGVSLPSLGISPVTENPKNKELGSLLHHSSSITALYFPTRSKLLSAAEDNIIAISRTRDWTVLSTIKAPIPKAIGRPSGDTAPFGGTPAGVNDFAVHPSMKLMISVGKGEKCMRLWNLVTGKKVGVLTFEREILQGVGEGRWASGEGRKVEWNSSGNEFVVGFERGAVVFGMVRSCTFTCYFRKKADKSRTQSQSVVSCPHQRPKFTNYVMRYQRYAMVTCRIFYLYRQKMVGSSSILPMSLRTQTKKQKVLSP